MNVVEIVPFWPAEVFIQRHLLAFNESQFKPQIMTRKNDYSLRSSSILSTTDLKAKELPRFEDTSLLEKAQKAASLFSDPALFFDKRAWQDKLLLSFFKRNRPDLIHFHWANLAVKLSWLPVELKIPFSFSMRGHDVQQRMINKDYVDQMARTIELSAGVHSVSENIWEEAVLLCNLEKNIFHRTIYTTVPVSSRIETSYKQKGPYTFVMIGRFHWRKNFEGLLLAFKKLITEGLNAKLIIIGDGDLKECVYYWVKILKITNSVTFTGSLTYFEIKKILENSDAYIQSSIAEGFSNSLAEAMGIGIPVFATTVGGTQEIIKDSENGFLLDVEHPENWWEKFILVTNYQKMQEIRLQAWKDAEQNFSSKKHAEEFIDFYSKSISINNTFAKNKDL